MPGDWLMLDNMRVQHGRLPLQVKRAARGERVSERVRVAVRESVREGRLMACG